MVRSRTPSRSIATTCVVVGVVLVFCAGGAAAQEAPGEPLPVEDDLTTLEVDIDAARPWLDDPRSSPLLGGVAVQSATFDAAVSQLTEQVTRRDQAETDRTRAEDLLAELSAAQARLEQEVIVATRQTAKFTARTERLARSLRDITVAEYVSGRTGSAADAAFDLDQGAANDGRRHLVSTAFNGQLDDLTLHRWALATTTVHLEELQGQISEVQRRTAETSENRDRAIAERDRAEQAAREAVLEAADARRTAPVVGLDMTFVVLDAYVRAADALGEEDPSCGLEWSLLAGIGRTESVHGTFGASSVDAEGYQTQPIIGIALDGNGVALIPDSDGGALDGDTVFDRAVGPMQFIPGTWRRWGRDATGSGEANPQNYYDAAMSAAAYLCNFGPGLDGPEGRRRGLFAYNRSTAYVAVVGERADGYASFVLPSPPAP